MTVDADELREIAARAYATAKTEYPGVSERLHRATATRIARREIEGGGSGMGVPTYSVVSAAIDAVADAPRTWAIPEPPGPEVRYLRTADGDVLSRDSDEGTVRRHWRRRFAPGTYGTTRRWVALLGDAGPLTDVTAEIEATLAERKG